ncbi:uncharacterized protein ISCGN_013991 [Ixodes scapularis]
MAAATASTSTARPDSLSWSKSLVAIPSSFTVEKVDSYYAARKTSERNKRRSYKFVTESYVEASSLETASLLRRHATFVVVRGRCYRSQKKSGRPYGVTATFSEDGSVWASSCECAAKEGLCNHALALLRLVVLLKKQGYEEPPPEVACTELPQQWRRPRGSQIPATSVAEVDWRAVRDGGSSKPRGSRLYDARKRPRDLSEMQDAIHRLGSDLCALGDSPFAKHLRTVQILGTESKFGMVPVGSPLSYQQPTSPHGFATYTSPNIALRSRDLSNSSPCWPVLFSSASTYEPATQSLSDAETSLLQELVLTPAGARRLEKNSRQQAKSATWRAARKDRLTASSFGVVLMRESWTAIGLRNLVQVRDLSRVRAIQHGIKHEPQAVQHYRRALHSLGHDVEISACGLLVDPACPWLGASPDRLVYDPTEAVPHGVVEVKCPYTIWDCAEPDSKSFYMVKDSAGVYRLSRDHHYYFQLLGQMALSDSLWGDFVVYCKHFLIVERISFSLPDWVRCKEALDTFYFATLLPYLVEQRNRSTV